MRLHGKHTSISLNYSRTKYTYNLPHERENFHNSISFPGRANENIPLPNLTGKTRQYRKRLFAHNYRKALKILDGY